MPESTLVERLRTLTTPHLADACLRAGTSFPGSRNTSRAVRRTRGWDSASTFAP